MRFLRALIAVSFVVLLVSFWNRNALPGRIDYVDRIDGDPHQIETERASFEVTYNDVEYRIDPEFEYDLTGMVVSYRYHEGDSRMHRLSNDHLNMLDICVIWGDNTRHPDLGSMEFWNGIFTCIITAPDRETWEAFDMNQVSNNHLISDRESIRDDVLGIRIGDQVRIRGLLASYTNPAGGTRGTSTTRSDTGDGACETIYVEQFEIVRNATSLWRISMWLSLAMLVGCLVTWFRRPYRPYAEED